MMSVQKTYLPAIHSIYSVNGRRAMVAHADESIIRFETELYNRTICMEPSAFLREVSSGEIRLIQEVPFSTEVQALIGLSPSQMQEHQRRLHYVKFFYERFGSCLPRQGFEEARKEAAEKIGDPKPYGYTQMHKLCKKYWEHGRSETALIGTQQIFNRRAPRLKEEVHDIIAANIDEFYLRGERPTVAHLHRIVCGRIVEMNKGQYRTRPLDKPAYGTVREAIDRIDIFHRTTRREGIHTARRRNARGRPIEYENRIGARVEADSQLIDVLVLNAEFGITMRPYLTLFLDVASRCVLGWDLSFSNASGEKTLRALCNAMVDDGGGETRAVPEILIIDNGKEFVNKNMLGLANDIRIMPRQAAPKCPNQKSFVERLFKTFNDQFFHTIPGTTKSSPVHRGEYDSEENAVIELESLNQLFGQYISEVYHYTTHSDLGCPPIVKWRDLEKEVPPRTMSPDEARLKTCIRRECSINHGRVKAESMSWEGPALPTLESKLKTSQRKLKATLFIDPSQIGKAWVQDPFGNSPLIEVTNILPDRYHRFSLGEMELIQEIWKSQNQGRFDKARQASVDVAVVRLFDDIKEASISKKSKRDLRHLAKKRERHGKTVSVSRPELNSVEGGRIEKQLSQTLKEDDEPGVWEEKSPPKQTINNSIVSEIQVDVEVAAPMKKLYQGKEKK